MLRSSIVRRFGLSTTAAGFLCGAMLLAQPAPQPGGPASAEILSIAVSPSVSGHVLAATSNGLFVSRDGGDGWARVTGLNARIVLAVEFDPAANGVAYAGVERGGLHRSEDAGSIWTRVDGVPETETVKSVAILPTGEVMAGVGDGIWRRSSAGEWRKIVLCPTCGRDAMVLATSPADATQIWAAAGSGLYRSTDSGATWIPFPIPFCGNSRLRPVSVQSVALDRENARRVLVASGRSMLLTVDAGSNWGCANIGSTVTAVEFSGHAFAAADSTVFRSIDEGVIWTPLPVPRPGTIQALAGDPLASATLYAGSDLGLNRSREFGDRWTPADTGIVAPSPTAVAFASDGSVTAWLAYNGAGIHRANASGGGWSLVAPPAPGGYRFVAAGTGTTYALNGSRCPLRTRDGGATWSLVSGFPACPVIDIATDPSTTGTVYAIGFDGLYRSDDNGETWNLMPEARAWTRVAVDRTGTVLTPIERAIRISRDRGATWTEIPNRLRLPRQFVLDPVRPETVYAATDAGIQVSRDGGTSWQPAAIPELAIRSIVVLRSGILAAATSSGIWRSGDAGATWSAAAFLSHDVTDMAVDRGADTLVASVRGLGVQRSADGGTTWNPTPQR